MSDNSELILHNLLKHSPVDGSMASHEAWKQNVRLLLNERGSEILWREIHKTGYVSVVLRSEALRYVMSLTSD